VLGEFGICLTATHDPIFMWLSTFFRRDLQAFSKILEHLVCIQRCLRLYAQWLSTLFCTGGTIHPLAVTCYSVRVGITALHLT